MNGYLSHIIQRNMLPGASVNSTQMLTPSLESPSPFGPSSIPGDGLGIPTTDGEVLLYLQSPLAKETSASQEKSQEIQTPNRIAPIPQIPYFERHSIRSNPENVSERHSYHTSETTITSKETTSSEFIYQNSLQPNSIIQSPFALPEESLPLKKVQPLAKEIKPKSDKPRNEIEKNKKGNPFNLLQPVIETQEITVLTPSISATATPQREKKSKPNPKLVIGKLTVEVVQPKPKVQTIQPSVQDHHSPPEVKPFVPYNKLTFGLGQL